MFRLKKNACAVCSKTISNGYDKALQIVKMKPNKVIKKKKQMEEQKNKILAEIQEKS